MQSTSSILPDSTDNLDITLEGVLLLTFDMMSMMDLDDSSRRLSSVSHVHDDSHVAPSSATTDERRRYHALEHSYTSQNIACSIDQRHLPEPEKVERPNLSRSTSNPSPTKKQHQQPQQQQSSPASCANANTNMSGNSFMSSGEFAEGLNILWDVDNVDTIVVPTQYDVKCGRGGDTIQHNRHFIDMCEAKAEKYAATGKGMNGKQGIVTEIVLAIYAKGGRFIKQSSSGEWQVVSLLQDAMDKTSHCIRDINLKSHAT